MVTELLQGKIPKKKESLFTAFWQRPPKAWRAGMACGHGARACVTWIVKFLTTWIEQKNQLHMLAFLQSMWPALWDMVKASANIKAPKITWI